MPLEIERLHLATLAAPGSSDVTPVHGFVVRYDGGAALVDTGAGGPDRLLNDWRVVNVAAADALARLDMTPADISLVINTHLHFDHCGQNAVFKHAPFYIQRAELERARADSAWMAEWFDFMGARFELLDGDAEIVPGLSVLTTPGHTTGHQSVVIKTAAGEEVLIGDAAYAPEQYNAPPGADLPEGQARDVDAWWASLDRVKSAEPARVHFCHHTDILGAHS
jgi:N-acyl homoserine lactone hydrolase